MCGIIACTGTPQTLDILLDGLRRLEYRGYDSSGVVLNHRKRLRTWKAAGRLDALLTRLPEGLKASTGIGHTRWATHGAPTDTNAHPHLDTDSRIAVVHNGIVENASRLREQLSNRGVQLISETDTELLAHLIAGESGPLIDRVRRVLLGIVGTYGLAVTSADEPDTVVMARMGSPVILGIGDQAMFAASDVAALSRHTQQIVHLEDGELAELKPDAYRVMQLDARELNKSPTTADLAIEDYDRGGYTHYLQREICDQPEVVRRVLAGRLDHRSATTRLGGLNLSARELLAIRRIRIIGCGSALYAGMAGAQMIESLARLPVTAESAAEFRYRNPVFERDTLTIAISQSGETHDTLAAVHEVQRKGGFVLGIVNTVGSSIARQVDGGIYMHAGPEFSVASTKAYTSMLCVFSLLAITFGRLHDLSPQRGSTLLTALQELPEAIEKVLELEPVIADMAHRHAKANSAFFIGRTQALPVALEGAQKLKELSYIHAEAYPSSELKHGPLALLTADTPCIVVLPQSELFDKSLSAVEEVRARDAPVIAVTDAPPGRIDTLADAVIRVPVVEPLLQGIVMGVALQLLAYHAALSLDRDVDRPRNLAKSVTVE